MITYKERISVIKRLIPDGNLRNVIFNFEFEEDGIFLSDEKDCLSYFSNVLVFTSIVVITKFLKWKKEFIDNSDNGEINTKKFSNSMIRIYNMLNRAYDPIKINGDFVDELIMNLAFDFLTGSKDQNSFINTIGIEKFFNFPSKNNNLSKYIYFLKQKRISSRFNCEFGFEELFDCLQMFPYLLNYKVDFENFNFKYCNINCNKIIMKPFFRTKSYPELDLNYSVFNQNNTIYYMEDFAFIDAKTFSKTNAKNQILFLNYTLYDSPEYLSIMLTNKRENNYKDNCYEFQDENIVEDFLIDYDIINNSQNSSSAFFKDYVFINNKYIKYLALTISDTITTNTKSNILNHYKKYSNIFKKMQGKSFYIVNELTHKYRWDEIILFIMIEEGIHDVLRFLFSCGETYEAFIHSFINRFGKETIENIMKIEPFIRNPQKNIQFGTKSAKYDCMATALIMLASRLLDSDKWQSENSYYPISIDDMIVELERASEKYLRANGEEKIFHCINTLIRVVSFIDTFYICLLEYSKEKRQSELSNEIRIQSNTITIKEKELWISKMKNTLQLKKRVSYDVCSNLTTYNSRSNYYADAINEIKYVFDSLIKTNKTLSNRNNPYNEVLFHTTGKRAIFEYNDMELFKNKVINILVNISSENKPVEKSKVEKLHSLTKSFMEYLKTGTIDPVDESFENAIYPIVGHCKSGVVSRDGYSYSYFNVDCNDIFSEQICIKMITEEHFDFGHSYYCIPNINRIASIGNDSFEHVWINPTIIPCSIFLPQLVTHISRLEEPSDFDDAIELIYNSDIYLYSKLFGTLDNAKKIMPLLLNDSKSKFYKSFYHILKQDNKIVAIAALYNSRFSEFTWENGSDIKRAFYESSIDMPKTSPEAIMHLEKSFYNCTSNNYCLLDDLCVRKDCRDKGIGRSLLLHLIKEAEESNKGVLLTVYFENKIAKKLYDSVGFVPYARMTKQCKVENEYIEMIKM